MSADDLTTTTIIVATAFLLGAPLLGLLIRFFVTRHPEQIAAQKQARQVILDGISKVVLAWSTLAGVYGAVVALPLDQGWEEIASNFILAAVIMSGAVAAARVTSGFVSYYASRHQRLPGATSIFANIARFVVLAVGALVTLQTLGVSVGPILTALGVGGLAVALALQDTLANLFAGLHVIGSRKVLPGDYVLLDSGEEGYIEDINWRNTSMRNLRNNVIVVPNAKLANAILTNYYQPASEMSLIIPVGVAYDSDLDRVERVTIDVGRQVMKEVTGGVPEFDPFIRFHTFNDFSIDFSVILRVKEHTDQYLVKHEFVKRLQRRYGEVGIEIPFPIRRVISENARKPEDARAWIGA